MPERVLKFTRLVLLLEESSQAAGDVDGVYALAKRIGVLYVHQGLVYLLAGELRLLDAAVVGTRFDERLSLYFLIFLFFHWKFK